MATRYISTALDKPVISSRRAPKNAIIPPISFVGELEIDISGFWFPTSTMEIKTASLTASGPGSLTAYIFILKEEPYTGRPLVIAQLSLDPLEVKKVVSMNNILITPYDKLYAASFVASGHTGVVLQMVGSVV